MTKPTAGTVALLTLAVLLAQAGIWGSVAAYAVVAGTAGVLSLRMPQRHSKAIGLACFVFIAAHIARTIEGPAAYEAVLSGGYIFIAYATWKIFRRSSTRRVEWSLILEAGPIGAALTTTLLFNPYFNVPSAKLIVISLSTAGVIFILMSDLGRRTAPITKRYLAAIVIATWMEAFDQFLPDELFSAFFTAPYYPLVAGLLLPEADRELAPAHVPSRRRFGLPQLALFAGTIVASAVIAYLNGAMPLLWTALAILTTSLVFARISLLIRQRDWSFAQEHELRQYGERLISLTSTEQIDGETLGTLRNLGAEDGHYAILEITGSTYKTLAEAGSMEGGRKRAKFSRFGATDPTLDNWFAKNGQTGTALAVRVPEISNGARPRYFVCRTPSQLDPETESHYQAAAAQYSLAIRAQELTKKIHEQKARFAADQARREAQEAWQALSVGSHEVALRVHDGIVSAATPHADEILGIDPLGLNQDELEFLDPEHVDGAGFENPRQPGQWFKVTADVVADGSQVYTIRDVTAEVVDAVTDSVTGFPTQSTLEALDHDGGGIPGAAMHLIDFGNVELLRERHGRAVSDHALRTLAERTQRLFRRDEDHFWRSDQDRVLVVTAAAVSEDELERRRREIAAPLETEVHETEPKVTIATMDVDPNLSIGATIQRLQIAINHALQTDVGVVRFNPELYATVKRRWDLERAFKRALADPAHGGFTVHYQPIVSALPTARPVAVEALARWSHPDLGAISPVEFIPVAERMGMIDAIDTFVLNQALNDIEIFRQLDPDFAIHVNLSPAKSLAAKFAATRNAVILHGADKASSIVVEVTESALGGNDPHDELIDAAQRLRDLGVGIAVDDFGTGESNFDRIDTLPFTEVKLAGKISVATDPVFVASIVNNFHGLDLIVVAENVEDQEQLNRLREAGVDLIQGFYYHRPAEIDTITSWIRERLDESFSPGESLTADLRIH